MSQKLKFQPMLPFVVEGIINTQTQYFERITIHHKKTIIMSSNASKKKLSDLFGYAGPSRVELLSDGKV